jgi:hypothetical protein
VAGIFTAASTFVAIPLLLAPVFERMPQAALAAVVTYSVGLISLADFVDPAHSHVEFRWALVAVAGVILRDARDSSAAVVVSLIAGAPGWSARGVCARAQAELKLGRFTGAPRRRGSSGAPAAPAQGAAVFCQCARSGRHAVTLKRRIRQSRSSTCRRSSILAQRAAPGGGESNLRERGIELVITAANPDGWRHPALGADRRWAGKVILTPLTRRIVTEQVK